MDGLRNEGLVSPHSIWLAMWCVAWRCMCTAGRFCMRAGLCWEWLSRAESKTARLSQEFLHSSFQLKPLLSLKGNSSVDCDTTDSGCTGSSFQYRLAVWRVSSYTGPCTLSSNISLWQWLADGQRFRVRRERTTSAQRCFTYLYTASVGTAHRVARWVSSMAVLTNSDSDAGPWPTVHFR